jgi:purine-binding chemotaxis protein CheW
MPKKKAAVKKNPQKKKVEMPLWFEEQQKITPDIWEILKYRAKELEAKKQKYEDDEKSSNFLGFIWGTTKCAINVNDIEEIKEFEYIEPVPNTPDILLGVLNLRGEIIPVFDIRELWSIAREELTEEAKIFIMDKDERKFGFLADSIVGTMSLNTDQILPAANYSGELNNPYTLGVYTQGEELWMVLNARAIIEANELIISD